MLGLGWLCCTCLEEGSSISQDCFNVFGNQCCTGDRPATLTATFSAAPTDDDCSECDALAGVFFLEDRGGTICSWEYFDNDWCSSSCPSGGFAAQYRLFIYARHDFSSDTCKLGLNVQLEHWNPTCAYFARASYLSASDWDCTAPVVLTRTSQTFFNACSGNFAATVNIAL